MESSARSSVVRLTGWMRLDRLRNLPEAWGWLVLTVAFANMTAFVVNYSNPIVSSDAWYFLDVFISKALNGTLSIGDFFARRAGLDHAQPLRKLILLWETRSFHLDFRVEALAGVACALIFLLLVRRVMRSVEGEAKVSPVLLWSAATAVILSLNSTGVWTWPLVCSAYTSYALLMAFCVLLWRSVRIGAYGWLAVSAMALDLAADDSAILATVAAWLALGLVALREPAIRRPVLRAALVLLVCLIAGRIALAVLYSVPGYHAMPLGTRIGKLASAFADGGWWQWVLVPLGSSVAYILPLKSFYGAQAVAVQAALGALIALAHIWFWWRAFRNPVNAPTFVGVLLMLFFYALLAGIIYGRVVDYGNTYLHQPRYVMFYSFNIVALLLMCAGNTTLGRATTGPTGSVLALACIALVAWQYPLASEAWRIAPYGSQYHQKMARQIWYMAEHHSLPPENCLPLLTVCNYPAAKRQELIELLRAHRLNVFSPAFQRANHLQKAPSS